MAASIAVRRRACFCGRCCYGIPTSLPWGIRFPRIDDLLRHPAQLYESVFHLSAAIVCAWCIWRRWCGGQLIKLYFLSYFGYRFVTELIRPETRVFGGMTAYQWSALQFVLLFAWLWWRDEQAFTDRRII